MPPESQSKILNAVRSPLVFNALALISLSGVLGTILLSNVPTEAKIGAAIVFFLWVLGQTLWINWVMRRDPRALCYGPNEYLAESRLKYEHDRKMAKLE